MTLKEGTQITFCFSSEQWTSQACLEQVTKTRKENLCWQPAREMPEKARVGEEKGAEGGKKQTEKQSSDFVWFQLETFCSPNRRTDAFSKYKQNIR